MKVARLQLNELMSLLLTNGDYTQTPDANLFTSTEIDEIQSEIQWLRYN